MNLKNVLQKTQSELLREIPTFLEEFYAPNKIVNTSTFIYVKGDIPIMLVAHLDTVHSKTPKQIFVDKNEGMVWSPEGLGADDRAGVYAIMKIIKDGYKPYIMFTTDEEIGGIGAKIASKLITPPKNLKYLIELDRRGSNDAVFYWDNNGKFETYVEEFGFLTNFGSFSDISVLCPAWEISGVNLSIGYYDEHTKQEKLNYFEMMETIDKVKMMLANPPEDRFIYEETIFIYKSYKTSEPDWWGKTESAAWWEDEGFSTEQEYWANIDAITEDYANIMKPEEEDDYITEETILDEDCWFRIRKPRNE